MRKEKLRLDVILLEQGLFVSREKARAAIMAGRVLVNGQPITKAGTPVRDTDQIQLRGEEPPYVSRGGTKLAKALQEFTLSVAGKTVLDIGASTGGFTDCLLQNGAAKVVAIDVGYGQLAWSLRQDSRVICLERTNVRYLTPEKLPVKGQIATIDLSFISLEKIFPSLIQLLEPGAQIIALIKPQFEAGVHQVGKNGVVKDTQVHREVIALVIQSAAEYNLILQDLTYSPLLGPKGNIEFLAWFRLLSPQEAAAFSINPDQVEQVVHAAHAELHAKAK